MADVRRRRPAGPGPSGRPSRERGQLVLVTALSLAILFVALALILNTAIYTENLATRSSDIGGGTDAVRYHDAARTGVGGVVGYVNAHNNTSFDTLRANLSSGVDAFRNHSARQFAYGDRAVETTLNATVNGTRIAQTNTSRNFSNASGTADWLVASDVTNTRAVRFRVSRTNLLDLLSAGFRVSLDDGSTYWNLTVYRPGLGDDIEVAVDGPTASGTCTVTAAKAWINVSEGTFGGEPCPELQTFGAGLSGSYAIRYENGADVNGTYTMIVDNETLAGSPGPDLVAHGAGQPFAAHAVYSVEVDVVYETPRLHYEATVRIAPEEADG